MISEMIQINDTPIQEMPIDNVISIALNYLERKLRIHTQVTLGGSEEACTYLRLQFATEQEEVFSALFLNSQNQLLAFEKLFRGTINESQIYPRTIVQRALKHNAARVIVSHNHPSNHCRPSESDIELTKFLKQVLCMVDILLVDHVLVTHQETYSFAHHGLL